jgi:hypothetical protein
MSAVAARGWVKHDVKPIYSVWWYDDGGPMAPKCRAYRLHTNEAKRERSTEMFRSWLDVRERESV